METNREKYQVRDGAKNDGIKYELTMASLFSVRLGLDETVKDFKLSLNNNEWNNFDDIVIEVEYTNNETKKFAIQLKQRNKHSILVSKNFCTTKHLNLIHYYYGFEKFCSKNTYFIISTTDENKATNVDFSIVNNSPKPEWRDVKLNINKTNFEQMQFVNTSKSMDNIEQFSIENAGKINPNYFLSLRLISNQSKLEEVEKIIVDIFKETFNYEDEHIVKELNEFIEGRSMEFRGKHYKITKADVLLKIIELLLSSSIKTPNLDYYKKYKIGEETIEVYNKNKIVKITSHELLNIWNQLTKIVAVMILNSMDETSKNYMDETNKNAMDDTSKNLLWIPLLKKLFNSLGINPTKEDIPLNEILKTESNHEESNLEIFLSEKNKTDKINLKFLYIACWKNGLVPLVLEENKNRKNLIKKILEISKNFNLKINFILLNCDESYYEFSNTYNVLFNLHDCREINKKINSDVYNKIINYFPIKIQNRYNCTVNNFLNNDEFLKCLTSKHIFEMALQKLNVGKSLGIENSNLDTYLDRTLSKTMINLKVLDNDGDIFIVKNLLASNILRRKNILEYKENFTAIVSENPDKNVHLLKFNNEENYLEHIETKGSMKILYNYQNTVTINDKELFKNFEENVTLIIADPGMGKTYLINKLAISVPHGYWSLYVTLDQHIEYFSKNLNDTNILSHFYKKYEENDSLTTIIFDNFLIEKKIFIFLDGFDEISPTYTNRVVKIMKLLHENQYKLFLTSRNNMSETIKNEFNTFPYHLKHLNSTGRKKLIQDKFKKNITDDEVNKILEWLKQLDEDFFGSPLASNMVCEIYENNNNTLDQIDKVMLLENYVTLKIKVYQQKFFGKDNVEFREKVNESLNKHKELSLLLFFDKNICDEIFSIGMDEFIASIKHTKERIGIITKINPDGLPVFEHRLIAEYLTSVWLVENRQNYTEIMKQLFQIDKIIIRDIFDKILSRECTIHAAVIDGDFDKITCIVKENKASLNKLDDAGRTPLHLACSWGITYNIPLNNFDDKQYYITSQEKRISFKKILAFFIEQGLKPDVKEHIFNKNCFYYAEITNNLYAIDKLLNKFDYDLKNLQNIFTKPALLYYSSKYNFLNILKKLPPTETELKKFKFGDSEQLLIHVAAEYGRFKILEYYLKNFKNCVNLTDKYEQTALHIASKNGYESLVTLLLDYGSDIDAKTYGWTALFHSVERKHINICKELIKRNCNINIKDFNGCSPICYSLHPTNTETFELLLNHGASHNIINHEGDNLLNLAIMANADLICLKLLEKKFNVNARNGKRRTPIHLTVSSKNTVIAEKLIKNGADINIPDNIGNTPLHLAIEFSNKDLIALLLKSKPKIEIKNVLGLTAISMAVKKGDYETYKLLEQCGAELNCEDSLRNTLLHLAVESKSTPIIDDLLHKKFNTNATNVFGRTPVFCAIETNNINLYNLLKSSIINIDMQDFDLNTLLCKAIEKKLSEVAIDLIKSGANVNMRNLFGRTPLLIATKRRDYQVFKALLNHKANVQVSDNTSNTALHFAVKYNSQEIIDELLKNGVNVNARDVRGTTPFHIAIENLDLTSCLKLKKFGADLYSSDIRFNTPLHLAVLNNAVTILENFASEWNCDVNSINYQGRTPIALAVETNNCQLYKKLKCFKPDMSIEDSLHMNLIHLAVNYNSYEILCDLLENENLNLEHVNIWGETPLMIAIKLGDGKSYNVLKEKDASLKVFDKRNNTPLHLAFMAQNNEITHDILKSGANLNLTNWLGRTPIHYASIYGDADILKHINVRETELDAEDKYENVPLYLAEKNKNNDAYKWLINNGANRYLIKGSLGVSHLN